MLSSELSIRMWIACTPSAAVTTRFATTTATGCRASHRANAPMEPRSISGDGRPERGWTLERALDAGHRDHGIVPEPLVVHRDDPVREHHDLPPHDDPRPEREVVEVLPPQIEAEERADLGPVRGQVEELRLIGVRGPAELAPSEEAERDPDPRRDVDVDSQVVAGVALLDVVGVEVDAEVHVRLDAAPEHGRPVVERRRLERPGALEVVLVAGREPEPQPERVPPRVPRRELVHRAEEDVADAELRLAELRGHDRS